MKPEYKYVVSSDSMSKKSTPLVETKVARAPTVYFSDYAWAQLWKIIDYCNDEVGWYGLVDELDNDYLITELFVPEQEVSGVTTDIEPEAMAKLAAEIEADGKDSSKLRYWGHSHVTMAVRPSGTDEEQIQEYLDHVPWFIRGIHNKKGESKVDVYDVAHNVIHQCCDAIRLVPVLSKEDEAALLASIRKNVTKKQYGYQGNFHHQRRGGTPQHVNGNVKNGSGSAANSGGNNGSGRQIQTVDDDDDWGIGDAYGYNDGGVGGDNVENFPQGGTPAQTRK